DAHVRFQCALGLGDIDSPQKVYALATIASHADADRWTRAAVLSSAKDCERALFAEVMRKPNDGMGEFLFDLGKILGKTLDEKALKELCTNSIPAMAGIAEGHGTAICAAADLLKEAEAYLTDNGRPLPYRIHSSI